MLAPTLEHPPNVVGLRRSRLIESLRKAKYQDLRMPVHSVSDGSMLRPLCGASLRLFTGPSLHATHQLPHAFAMFNRRWAKIEILFLKCLDGLSLVDTTNIANVATSEQIQADIIASTSALIYEISELMEDYEDNYFKTIFHNRQFYRAFHLTKRARDHICLQCNQIKHNHANAYFIEQANRSGRIAGYVIMSHNDDGALAPHPVIHKTRQAFSYNVELRILFASMYSLDNEVNDFLKNNLSIASLPIGAERVNEKTIELINRVVALPTLAFSRENVSEIPLIEFKDNVLLVESSGGKMFHGWARQWTQLSFVGDSVTTQYVLPMA